MSKAYDDAMEEAGQAAMAKQLGLTADEYDEVLDYLDADTSDDGLVYGFLVYFQDGADIAILSKIPDWHPGDKFVRVPSLFADAPDEE